MDVGSPKHRFWLAQPVGGQQVRFSPEQAHQVSAVLRLRVGARVRVFHDAEPLDYVVQLTRVSERETEGDVVGTLPQPPEPTTHVAVYPSLLQRDKFEQVLQKLVEVGAASVTPVLSARSLVREPPDARRLARWQAILREAAEQSGRGRLPELFPSVSFEAGIRQAAQRGPTLLAYEAERTLSLREALRLLGTAAPPTLSLFVGPEGGYTDQEVSRASEAGALVVSLGPRVLRSETASPVFVALALHDLEG